MNSIIIKLQKSLQYIHQGRLTEGDKLLNEILINDYLNFDAIYMKGIICGMQSKHAECKNYLLRAEKINSNHAFLQYNLAKSLSELGEEKAALDHHKQAVKLMPKNHEAWINLGKCLFKLKLLKDSLECCDKSIEIKRDYAEAYSNRGIILKELNRLEEALLSYDKSIELKHSNPEAYSNRGVVLNGLGRLEEAIISYDKAIQLKPEYQEAHYNRGNLLNELNRLEEALLCYDKSIELKKENPEAYTNRGNVLNGLSRLEEALVSYDKAIEQNPENPEAHSNRGFVLNGLGRLEEALISYDKAIELRPDYAEAYWNKSLTLLLTGDFEKGLSAYEWGWKTEKKQRGNDKLFTQPIWLGNESLANKTILLWCEQGLGDSIQFSRYAKLVKEVGARVLLEVPKTLLALLEGLEGVDMLIEEGDTLPEFDFQCPLMSLPLAFKTDLNSIPSPKPYLKSKPAKVDAWSQLLGKKSNPRIGLAWSGNTNHKNDHNRSMLLVDLIKHLPSGFEYFSLQKEVREADKEALVSSNIKHLGEQLKDFADTAALCELMDLVICVDTSVAHLAGSLGKATWVMLPFAPDWRWLLDRDDSPWYRNHRLFRQSKRGHWDNVFKEIETALLSFSSNQENAVL